jgi:hypothetical protein
MVRSERGICGQTGQIATSTGATSLHLGRYVRRPPIAESGVLEASTKVRFISLRYTLLTLFWGEWLLCLDSIS